jgi:predicted MFS family arabinose efflux permease
VFRTYIAVVSVRGARVPMVASMVGTVPIGMLVLGIVVATRAGTGSYAVAGLTAAFFGVGNALGLVVQGRAMARFGLSGPLAASSVVCTGALVTFAVAIERDPDRILLSALALLAGGAIPATTTAMRALWPTLITDPTTRLAAYSTLAVQFQLAMVTGPLAVAAVLTTGGPTDVLLVAAALAGGAGTLMAATPAIRRWRPAPAASSGRRRRGNGGIRTLTVASAGSGAAIGMLTLVVPAAAGGDARLAALLFAAMSIGELIGGIAYGARRWRMSPAVRLFAAMAGAAVAVAGLATVSAVPTAMTPLLAIVGACVAVTAVTSSALLDHLVPGGELARVYPTMVAAGLCGVAAGNAAGGHLVDSVSHAVTLVAAASILGTAAVWTRVRRSTLRDHGRG